MIVEAARLDVNSAAGLHREPLERVRQERQSEAADAVAGKGERDLGVRAAYEINRGCGARFVHWDHGGAVACNAFARAESLLNGAPERGENEGDLEKLF